MSAPESVDLTGRVSLVTGATGGMGQVIATELARLGSTVVIVCRNNAKGVALRQRIAAEVGADRIEVLTADLASKTDLHRIVEEFTARHRALHLLINNAAAYSERWMVNADGIESQLAVNYLAGFTLTTLLLERLRLGAPSRVVNVVTAAMSDTRHFKISRQPRPARLDPATLDDLRSINGEANFAPFEAYARAKLLATMSGYVLADRMRGTGVTVNAVHPGLVATDIFDAITPASLKPFGGLLRKLVLTPEQGAEPILRLATAPELAGVTGRYSDRDKECDSPPVSYDHELQKRLWATSQAYVEHDHVT
jgi:NAD(P)-dependent dehydrogenase (short-subunit alcohol dehydrogenase family)